MKRISHFYAIILEVLWAIALVGLFLTSFPIFSELTGALVAPISALPILLLLLLWFLPYILRKGKLPIESKLLFVFLLFALISSAQAFFIQIPTFKDVTPLHQEIRAFLTLAIGLSFYFIFASFPKDEPALLRSLRWINLGGLIVALATLPQVYYILIQADVYPKWIYITTDWFTKRTPYFFYVNRVSGFTYEPSWFAHQMILFYLPLWLASSITKTSAFRFRIFGLSLENILLFIGSIEFFLSAPRISLVGVLLIGFYCVMLIYKLAIRHIVQFVASKWKSKPTETWRARTKILSGVLLILTFILVSSGAFLFLLRNDARMENFFLYPPKWKDIQGVLALNETSLLTLANRMAFFERAIYWFTGLHVFTQFPWLGVGLGNAGFFFLDNVPSIGWTSYEILKVLDEQVFLPNTKSIFVRLLAETGLAGFTVFILFLYNLWRSTRPLLNSHTPALRLVALAGQFSLLALIGEGFSIDSFAMPYLWAFSGLISASALIYRQQRFKAFSVEGVPLKDPVNDRNDPETTLTRASPIAPVQSFQKHDHPHTD